MVSVIIPALNEQDTIANVVRFCLSNPHVTEVIVVDDKSIDETVSRAKAAGATVITSTKLGKGTSMKDGILYAKNDVLVFIDGAAELVRAFPLHDALRVANHFGHIAYKANGRNQRGCLNLLLGGKFWCALDEPLPWFAAIAISS